MMTEARVRVSDDDETTAEQPMQGYLYCFRICRLGYGFEQFHGLEKRVGGGG